MAAEGNGFEDVLTCFNHLMEHLRWKNLGHILTGENGDIGDIKGKPELDQAYELGIGSVLMRGFDEYISSQKADN